MILCYCISLPQALERRASILKQIERHGLTIEWVDAVAGQSIRYDAVPGYLRAKRLTYLPDLQKNEIACTLSHKKALETFLATDSSFAAILEDDALISPGFGETVDHVVRCARGWDLVKLESRTASPRGYRIGPVGDSHALFAPLRADLGSTAILYTRTGARKLLKSLDRFQHAFDTHLGGGWRFGLRLTSIHPPLVVEDASFASTIGERLCTRRLRLPGTLPWLRYKRAKLVHMLMKRVHAVRCRSRVQT